MKLPFYQKAKTIAVVGLSNNPKKSSFLVAKYLMSQGYRIIPVNPNIKDFMGIKSYKSLSEIPEKVDVVNIFRKSEYVSGIVEEAIRIKAKTIWMQEGIKDPFAARKAKAAGLDVVENMCMMKSMLSNQKSVFDSKKNKA